MKFPVYFNLFGHAIEAHQVMELLGYLIGAQIYLMLRRRNLHRIPPEQNLWIIVGCLAGALAGSKILAFVESIHQYWPHRFEAGIWLGGKTIVGGLAGGWIGVEIAKKFHGVRQSTGDLFVFPLIAGIAVGRVGCFLEGLPDHTYGIATNLPWGVDFGDGTAMAFIAIPRSFTKSPSCCCWGWPC
jgi:phosphatidylglycerol---prolipoprotein diacylglyceryl transferase